MLTSFTPSPRQQSLIDMLRDTAERHFMAHGVWPTCAWASTEWFDEFVKAAPETTCRDVLIVGDLPVLAMVGLEGVAVVTRMQKKATT